MDSLTLTLSGTSSLLSATYYPEIELDKNSNYVCALVDFHTYNTIPNVNKYNNKFHILKWDPTKEEQEALSLVIQRAPHEESEIIIPEGSYEFDEIAQLLENELQKNNYDINITYNTRTMKCMLEINEPVLIDFTKPNSIGKILGFASNIVIVEKYKKIFSDYLININGVNIIRVDCNIATGSFFNDRRSHTIHEFYPTVPAGYKIDEVPTNLIYLPIVGHTISNLCVRILDQNDNLIDFRGEKVTLRIHIKKN